MQNPYTLRLDHLDRHSREIDFKHDGTGDSPGTEDWLLTDPQNK